MTQTWHDTIEGAPHRGYKLEERRFGELTVVRAVDRRDTSILWLCRCDCGRVALRTTQQLTYSEKRGASPACCVCLSELRSGQFLQTRTQQTQRFVEMYAMSGTLYGEGFAQKFRDDMIDELAEHEIPRPTEEGINLPLEMQPLYCKLGGGQRAAYLVPMTGHLWRCFCGAHFVTGFACLACKEPVCLDCVKEEVHVCAAAKHMCWEKVMTPKVLLEVEAKGRALSEEAYEKQIERLRISKLTRALKEQSKAQETQRSKKALQEKKREEEATQKRHRALRKKHPWLAEEMGIAKKKRTRR